MFESKEKPQENSVLFDSLLENVSKNMATKDLLDFFFKVINMTQQGHIFFLTVSGWTRVEVCVPTKATRSVWGGIALGYKIQAITLCHVLELVLIIFSRVFGSSLVWRLISFLRNVSRRSNFFGLLIDQRGSVYVCLGECVECYAMSVLLKFSHALLFLVNVYLPQSITK